MEYLIEKISQTYTWLSDYYYGQQKHSDYNKLSPQQKILKLRQILQDQCIYSKSDQGKIQMYFTKIIQTPQYQKFSFTTQIPSQYPVPQKTPEKKLICIFGQYFLKLSQNIICPLTIQILFQQKFNESLPKFYIKNPNFTFDKKGQKLLRTAKPNSKFVQITINKKQQNSTKYKYKARVNGIQIILPSRNNDYKLDVKLLIDQCFQMIKNQFPFVKNKQQILLIDQEANIDLQTQQIKLLSEKLIDSLKLSNQKNNFTPQINQFIQYQAKQIISQLPTFIFDTKKQLFKNSQLEIFKYKRTSFFSLKLTL